MAADIDVSFACNDPADGNSLHKFEHVEFAQSDSLGFQVECALYGPETSVVVNLRSYPIARVRVGTRSYPLHGYRSHQGNFCWDAVQLNHVDARALLTQLLGLGFHVEEYATRGPLADLLRPLKVAK